ncbi:MAG: hypothetical protein GX288_01350 [Clostridiales bacterium]|nr:hypothetical protein [Clostridiales bacterium]
MNFIDSVSVGLFIFIVVILVLALLLLIVKLFSYAITLFNGNKSKDESHTVQEELPGATVANEEDFSSGTLKLINVDEATAAMIMAIVSHESGIPLSELCFKSIRLINE